MPKPAPKRMRPNPIIQVGLKLPAQTHADMKQHAAEQGMQMRGLILAMWEAWEHVPKRTRESLMRAHRKPRIAASLGLPCDALDDA